MTGVGGRTSGVFWETDPCKRGARKSHQLRVVVVLLLGLSGTVAGPAQTQSAEDQLGTWLILNSTVRFSDHWSLFTEAQARLWEVASNLNETVLRATAHYHFNPDVMVGFGYVRADSWPFEDDDRLRQESDRERVENRLYQQFAMLLRWGPTIFENRYRLEQRWLRVAGETIFSNRVRYRLQITTPLNRDSIEAGAYFLNFYDEIFVNFDTPRAFDQNRLYGAGGYQFTRGSNLQLGLMWQARSSADLFRLQVFYTHNFDLR
jgi:hypothetical protein